MKNKYILLIAIFLWLIKTQQAQKTFYTSIDPEPQGAAADYGNKIVEGSHGGWMITVSTHCLETRMDCYNLIETNELGELINQSHLPTINIRTIVKHGNYYYGVSSKYDSIFDNQVILNKFNLDLELVAQVEYGGVDSEYGDKIILGNDNHLVISGNVKKLHTDTLQIDLFMLEYDLELNMTRDTILPHPIKVRNYTRITKALDGGYLLNYMVFDPVKWNWNMAKRAGLTKLDKDWNIEWEKVTSDGANFLYYRPQILTTDDGYIMQWTKDSTILFNGERIFYWPYISKLDKHGNTVWRNDMIKNRTPVSIIKIIMAENGDILGCGGQEINNNQKLIGWVFRMNKNGEIIWQRWFERPFDRIQSLVVFRDMIEMDDGRLALTGFWYDSIPGVEYMDGNVGLFVLDSNGCLTTDCADKTFLTAVDQPEMVDKINPIKVFPNPSFKVLNIYFEESMNNLLNINIYSLDGHQLFSKDIYSNNQLVQIEHNLSSGAYILEIRSSKELLLNQKIIVLK